MQNPSRMCSRFKIVRFEGHSKTEDIEEYSFEVFTLFARSFEPLKVHRQAKV